jgi:wyosine [tRNA(Phe)-imidazoG37] synthetase (radical SAM superfamily)
MSHTETIPLSSKNLHVSRHYVFGPVPSRRLGLSLGVDVIPRKLCNLDCIYCEVGRTDKRAMRRMEYLPAAEIVAELRSALEGNPAVDSITFSGSGEPTLNSKIGEIIHAVKQMTNVPVAVITNGTLLYLEDVRHDLLEADIVLPSLDSVTAEMFQKVNRPHPKLMIGSILRGLKLFREEYKGKIWLEILLVKGYNDSDEEILLMKEILQEIKPDKIQLNTVVRPPSESWAQPVSEERMWEIQKMFGAGCEVIGSFSGSADQLNATVGVGDLMTLLRRRAMTLEELQEAYGKTREELVALIDVLELNGLIVPYRFQHKTYYRPIENFFNGFCG